MYQETPNNGLSKIQSTYIIRSSLPRGLVEVDVSGHGLVRFSPFGGDSGAREEHMKDLELEVDTVAAGKPLGVHLERLYHALRGVRVSSAWVERLFSLSESHSGKVRRRLGDDALENSVFGSSHLLKRSTLLQQRKSPQSTPSS